MRGSSCQQNGCCLIHGRGVMNPGGLQWNLGGSHRLGGHQHSQLGLRKSAYDSLKSFKFKFKQFV